MHTGEPAVGTHCLDYSHPLNTIAIAKKFLAAFLKQQADQMVARVDKETVIMAKLARLG